MHPRPAGRRCWRRLLGAAALAAALTATACSTHIAPVRANPAPTRRVPAGSVAVFPVAGSGVASPQTEISFRGLPRHHGPGRIRVVGSVSGVHTGRVVEHSDGRGASFVPNRPFAQGETVTVHTSLDLVGARGGTTSFRVARLPTGPVATIRLSNGTPSGAQPLHFRSRPDLQPPPLTVQVSTAAPGSGQLVFAPKGDIANGLEITDPAGHLEWYRPTPGAVPLNLQVARYRGRPVLSWWQGRIVNGYGFGVEKLVDSGYRPVATVRAGDGYQVDAHDFEITRENTALFTVYQPTLWDLRPYGGTADGVVLDGIVQEVDIPTGRVLFEWHSLDHIPLSDSYVGMSAGKNGFFDYVHLNSVDETPDGSLLISGRHTSALYLVDRRSGVVKWVMGGKHSDFSIPADATFHYQHDVRWQPDGTITVFDNGSGPVHLENQSSGLRIAFDVATHTVRLLDRVTNSPPILATSQGDIQPLANGDVFMGWGAEPYLTEYDPAGHLVFEAQLPSDESSYRAYRQDWTGAPSRPPALVVSSAGGPLTAYVSWNGDTRTVAWRLYAGPSRSALSEVVSAPRVDFETGLPVPAGARFVRAVAVDGAGRRLGASPVVAVG